MTAWDALPPTAQELGAKAGASATMEPPTGAWDAAPPTKDELGQPPEAQWSDLPKNLVEGLKETPATLKGLAKRAVSWPADALESAGEIALGGSPLETPTVKNFTDLVTGPIKAAKDYGVGDLLTGHPVDAYEKAKRQTIEHPIQTGMLAAPLAVPAITGAAKTLLPFAEGETGAVTLGGAAGGGEEAAAAGIPESNYLKSLGARGILNKAGVSAETLEQMTPRGVTPGDVGAKIASVLDKDGVLKGSANETYKNSLRAMNQAGKTVNSAMQAISDEGVEPVHDMSVIEPIQSEYVRLANSVRAIDRRLARQWLETAKSLSGKAEANDGVLTLDDIHSEMQEVGELFGKYERGTTQFKNNAKLYGKLANARDAMVDQIAERSGNPALSTALKSANAKYSLYSRVVPDMKSAAAVEATGEMEPGLSAMVSQEVKPLLSKLLLKAGGAQSKYGPVLMDAAQKGQSSLLVTHHILREKDPAYAKLTEGVE